MTSKRVVLVAARMLLLDPNKTTAPIPISCRAPVHHPVLSKQGNSPPPILSPRDLLLLWGLNSRFQVLAEETVSPQVCKAKQAATAISLTPSGGWTPGFCLRSLLKFKHTFSDCCSFFLVPVPINLSPNSASPFLWLGYLPPIPIKNCSSKVLDCLLSDIWAPPHLAFLIYRLSLSLLKGPN